MEKYIDKLIDVLIKNRNIKDVFTVPRLRYNDAKFQKSVDELSKGKAYYISSIDSYIEYYNHYFPKLYSEHEEHILITDTINDAPICKFEDANVYQVAFCKILLLLYVTQASIETVEFTDKTPYVGFRGVSNYKYSLVPSFYRDLDYNGVIDFNVLNKMYNNSNFISNYCKYIEKIPEINYSFLSFLQHAVAYSPLLDFTQDKNIALVFATAPNNINFNTYTNTDAGLYTFYFSNTLIIDNISEIDEKLKEHQVQYFNGKLSSSSRIFGKRLLECDINDFAVDYYCFTNSNNDRMKYQKGGFVYFQKCVIVNGKLFFPYSYGYITKMKIVSKNAENAKAMMYRKLIDNNPYIDIEHLLNPYSVFNDYTHN